MRLILTRFFTQLFTGPPLGSGGGAPNPPAPNYLVDPWFWAIVGPLAAYFVVLGWAVWQENKKRQKAITELAVESLADDRQSESQVA